MRAPHRSTLPIAVAAAVGLSSLIGTEAQAFEYLCSGWRITGFNSSGCAVGVQDSDGCGCSASTAPRWESGSVSFKVESEGGGGISSSTFVNAAQSAAESWNNISCSTMAVDASSTFAASDAIRWGDFNNSSSRQEIFFVASESDWVDATGSGAGGTLGVTVSPWFSWSCNQRLFADTDILINGFIFGGWSATSLEETVLHEIGHSLGLGHPCLIGFSGCPNSCSAVMAASAGNFTSPQQDDIDGLCGLYPGVSGGLGTSCDFDSDCTSGPCVSYQGFTYCSQSCSGSCPSGYNCRDIGDGNGNICARDGLPTVGESCTSSCEPGAFCVADGTGATCYEECDPATTSVCTDGSRCVGFGDGTGACFPAGSRQEGESCVLGDSSLDCAAGMYCIDPFDVGSDTCYRECDPTNPAACGSDYRCLEVFTDGSGLCFETAGVWESCDELVCESGLTCLGNGSSYTCYQLCLVANGDSDCDPGLGCIEVSDGDGICLPADDRGEGETCFYSTECADGLGCFGSSSGGECYAFCSPSLDNCSLSGQSCIAYGDGSQGYCDPPGGDGGGGGCTCDTSSACQSGCSCDTDCSTSSCACNTSSACQSGCNCDPDCGAAACTCDVSFDCSPGCACDYDCTTYCRCDETFYCDPSPTDPLDSCNCDTECPCLCDTTTACDSDCACDIDCADKACGGCEASSSGMAMVFMTVLALWRRRRNRK